MSYPICGMLGMVGCTKFVSNKFVPKSLRTLCHKHWIPLCSNKVSLDKKLFTSLKILTCILIWKSWKAGLVNCQIISPPKNQNQLDCIKDCKINVCFETLLIFCLNFLKFYFQKYFSILPKVSLFYSCMCEQGFKEQQKYTNCLFPRK